jgi:anti-anti-sigma factor
MDGQRQSVRATSARVAAPAGFRFGGVANFAFSASTSERGSIATLELTGEFDLRGTERFDLHMQHLLAGNPDHVVIDLRGLSFIDSSGLQRLVQTQVHAQQHRFQLWVVCGARDEIRKTLDLSGATKAFDVHEEPPDFHG